MSKHPKYNEIENYLTGQLSAEELTAFENAMNQSKELAEEVELQRLEHSAMERMLELDLMSKMAVWDKTPPPNPFEEKSITKPINSKNYNWIIWLIGGILGVSLLWYFTRPSEISKLPDQIKTETPELTAPQHEEQEEFKPAKKERNVPMAETEVPNQPKETKQQQQSNKKQTIPSGKKNPYRELALSNYAIPENLNSGVRSEETTTEKSTYEKAAEAFSQKGYTKALTLVGSFSKEEESNISYLRGHIYFKLGNYKNAVTNFEAVANNEWAPNVVEAEWYLLLSYLGVGEENLKNFEDLANKLANDEFSPYQKKAQQLLTTVNKLH